MESLNKQIRGRLSGNKEESISTRDSKTQSFRERKRSQSWIRRQFYRPMSWDYESSGAEYPAAVAAAAYAIQSLEESKARDQSLKKMKSKVVDAGTKDEPIKSAMKSSDDTSKPSFKDSGIASTSKRMPEKAPSLKKRISFADESGTRNKPEISAVERVPARNPSPKRPPAFEDKQVKITESKEPEITATKPDHPPTSLPKTQPVETRRQTARKPGPGDSMADSWEKEEMASIRERYEKLRLTIAAWETKKKKNAKRKIERIEAELDKRRAKAVQSYRSKIKRIEEIAQGARAQAEDNCRNEEFKVKEKANRIRLTGKLPATCLCF